MHNDMTNINPTSTPKYTQTHFYSETTKHHTVNINKLEQKRGRGALPKDFTMTHESSLQSIQQDWGSK